MQIIVIFKNKFLVIDNLPFTISKLFSGIVVVLIVTIIKYDLVQSL